MLAVGTISSPPELTVPSGRPAGAEPDRRPALAGGEPLTDRKVPRDLRHGLPVVEAEGGEIVWVAGVAVAEHFSAGVESGGRGQLVALSARRAAGP